MNSSDASDEAGFKERFDGLKVPSEDGLGLSPNIFLASFKIHED